MKGYKVVNYNAWVSMPDIFGSVREAEALSKTWKHRKGAVIERISPFLKEQKILRWLK